MHGISNTELTTLDSTATYVKKKDTQIKIQYLNEKIEN